MTDTEVADDCKRFVDYLQANGVKTRGHLLLHKDLACWSGDPKALTLATLAIAAAAYGFELVPK